MENSLADSQVYLGNIVCHDNQNDMDEYDNGAAECRRHIVDKPKWRDIHNQFSIFLGQPENDFLEATQHEKSFSNKEKIIEREEQGLGWPRAHQTFFSSLSIIQNYFVDNFYDIVNIRFRHPWINRQRQDPLKAALSSGEVFGTIPIRFLVILVKMQGDKMDTRSNIVFFQ